MELSDTTVIAFASECRTRRHVTVAQTQGSSMSSAGGSRDPVFGEGEGSVQRGQFLEPT
jgi:hypothetical protein